MVNSKKMSKSSIAVIVLSIFLVLSLILGFTGAWFTDKKEGGTETVTMGTIDISTSDAKVAVSKDVELNMPGDKITIAGQVKNTGEKAWIRYKLSHTYAAEDELKTALDAAFTGSYVYVETAVDAKTGTVSLTENATIPTTLGNTAQGATFSVSLTIEAIQWANNHDGTCADAFKAAGFETTEVAARA